MGDFNPGSWPLSPCSGPDPYLRITITFPRGYAHLQSFHGSTVKLDKAFHFRAHNGLSNDGHQQQAVCFLSCTDPILFVSKCSWVHSLQPFTVWNLVISGTDSLCWLLLTVGIKKQLLVMWCRMPWLSLLTPSGFILKGKSLWEFSIHSLCC